MNYCKRIQWHFYNMVNRVSCLIKKKISVNAVACSMQHGIWAKSGAERSHILFTCTRKSGINIYLEDHQQLIYFWAVLNTRNWGSNSQRNKLVGANMCILLNITNLKLTPRSCHWKERSGHSSWYKNFTRNPITMVTFPTGKIWKHPYFWAYSVKVLIFYYRFLMLSNTKLRGHPWFQRTLKLIPILNHLNAKFRSAYTLECDGSADESLMMWKERLSWKVCTPSKHARNNLNCVSVPLDLQSCFHRYNQSSDDFRVSKKNISP
jgi:hypothetical protein